MFAVSRLERSCYESREKIKRGIFNFAIDTEFISLGNLLSEVIDILI